MIQDNSPIDSIWLLGIDDIVYNHSSEPHFSILDFPLHLIFNRDELTPSVASAHSSGHHASQSTQHFPHPTLSSTTLPQTHSVAPSSTIFQEQRTLLKQLISDKQQLVVQHKRQASELNIA